MDNATQTLEQIILFILVSHAFFAPIKVIHYIYRFFAHEARYIWFDYLYMFFGMYCVGMLACNFQYYGIGFQLFGVTIFSGLGMALFLTLSGWLNKISATSRLAFLSWTPIITLKSKRILPDTTVINDVQEKLPVPWHFFCVKKIKAIITTIALCSSVALLGWYQAKLSIEKQTPKARNVSNVSRPLFMASPASYS